MMSSQSDFQTIAIEGNIGSGKSTLLNYLQHQPNFTVFREPVEKWQNFGGYNLLELMYEDPLRWSSCFQSYVLKTMMEVHSEQVHTDFKVMERSASSAIYCFANNLKECGLMSEVSHSVINEWFQYLSDVVPIHVDHIVYLRTDPNVAFERVKKRDRVEERSICFDYLERLSNLHDDWLLRHHFGPTPHVITVNADVDLHDMFIYNDTWHEMLGAKLSPL